MSSSIRRGTLAATALALAAASLSACAAGKQAETLEIKPDNAATSVGDVKIQNVNVVTPSSGSGPSAVTARIFNNGSTDEILRAITVKGAGVRVKLSPAKGEKTLKVPAGGSLALGGKGNASAVLPEAGSASVTDGNAQPVTFDLSRTGKVRLRATVVPMHGDYAEFGPTAQPSPGGTPGSGSPSSTESPSDKASGSASPDESASHGEGGEPKPAESPAATESGSGGDSGSGAESESAGH